MSESYIPIERWGKDHWSTLAYVAHWCCEFGKKGFLVEGAYLRRMRVSSEVHPRLFHCASHKNYPTIIKGGKEVSGHDDFSCLEDAVAEGLMRWEGTAQYPVFFMTEKGLRVVAELTAHKTAGGSFANFECGTEDCDA